MEALVKQAVDTTRREVAPAPPVSAEEAAAIADAFPPFYYQSARLSSITKAADLRLLRSARDCARVTAWQRAAGGARGAPPSTAEPAQAAGGGGFRGGFRGGDDALLGMVQGMLRRREALLQRISCDQLWGTR